MRLLFVVAVVVGLWPAAAAAQRDSSQDQTSVVSPAPLDQVFLEPGQTRLAVRGAFGQLEARGDTEGITVYGFSANASYSLDDRWFLFLESLYIRGEGESSGRAAEVAGGFLGGGGRLYGEPGGKFALVAALGAGGITNTLELGPLQGTTAVTGAGLVMALEAEIAPIKWVSIVPHVTAYQLLSVTLERNRIQVAEADVNVTFAVSGVDLWVYPDPEDRGSHVSLGASTSSGQGQESATSIFTAGYTMSFGGKDKSKAAPAPVPETPPPAPGTPTTPPPAPGKP